MSVDEEFGRAIGDFLKGSGMLPEHAVLGDFFGIVEITNMEADKGETQYALLLLGGVPKHRVWGLMKVARELLEAQDG